MPPPLFVDLMLGTPLALYIEKDVDDRDTLVELVKKHGGTVSIAYSAVPYILVDPHRRSGQNLFRQYATKKGKVVLDVRWIRECIKADQLLTFASNWANCKLTGTEPQAQETAAPATRTRIDPLVQQQPQFFDVYAAPIPVPPPDTQSQAWQATANISPHLTPAHMWGNFQQPEPTAPPTGYDYRYRQEDWGAAPTGPSTLPEDRADKPRGRKRMRTQADPAPSASSLVANRYPPARSPTPPTRVVRSTYGGNLFTADDVEYLKKYIDYCHEQGLVLSLREICERIAVKHQIRLGGYEMAERSESGDEDGADDSENRTNARVHASSSSRSEPRPSGSEHRVMHIDITPRARSPTPPRALFRSTTGKGVAFTDQDIAFLVRFMEYRKHQGKTDMVAFWKEVAIKAPHHSRASWMKRTRRFPQPPDKKRRYSRGDDILLAKYFYNKKEGTSDKIFQAFGRQYPHHPHHRIHKAKIDEFIERLANGESIDDDDRAAPLPE
ncbi:hypothetical protein C8J57DRAFT_1284301 [Mycena rebaudengoi]|nr:hypothetical protein C8J57DRAFT_1284301 [Mycena rebaudengoi]